MKIKDGFVLQELIDEYIVVPIGDEADRIHGVIRLNETGALLWNLLTQDDQTEDELVDAMIDKYSISQDMAKADVTDFINLIREYGCI